jgi:hypothetical protein
MSKELTVEELRERADELITAIEQDEAVTIVRDGQTIGTYAPFTVHHGVKYPFRDLYISPLEKPLDEDPAQIIIEERERERSEKKWRS